MRRWPLVLGLGLMVASTAVPLAGQAGPRGRMGGGPGPMGMGAAALALEHKDELGLSEAQVGRLEEIRGEAEEAVRPFREEMQASRPQRGSGERPSEEQRQAMRATMEEMRKALEPHDKAASEVLTAEQRTKLEALRPRRGGPPSGVGH
ncbi:MAG: Spy/CpxP family protein refolding chaperone [Gemmatimonadota bacterium]